MASSFEQVQAFHAAALAAGGTENGEPGPRDHYPSTWRMAFVLDLDGNNIEAIWHGEECYERKSWLTHSRLCVPSAIPRRLVRNPRIAKVWDGCCRRLRG